MLSCIIYFPYTGIYIPRLDEVGECRLCVRFDVSGIFPMIEGLIIISWRLNHKSSFETYDCAMRGF